MANAVGMAIAEAHLAACFNREGNKLVDHFTYVMAGDGDMMEGVVHEACSLAGHLRLGKLIVLYDDNKVTLAGSAAISSTENIEQRFKAYGWQVQKVADGNDVSAIDRAIKKAKSETETTIAHLCTNNYRFRRALQTGKLRRARLSSGN